MKKYVMLTLKKALRTYLMIFPFAIIGGITVGMYTFEHSTPEVIEAAIEQLGSYQALIAVTMIQTLVYSLFGWVVGYFIVDRVGLIKPFRFDKEVLGKVCPVILVLSLAFAADYFVRRNITSLVFHGTHRTDSCSLFPVERSVCIVLWKMVS